MAERFLLRVPDDEQPIPQRELEAAQARARTGAPPTDPVRSRPGLRVSGTGGGDPRADARSRWATRCDGRVGDGLRHARPGGRDVAALARACAMASSSSRPRADTRRVPLWDTVADDLERWRAASGAGPDDPVFAHPDTEWGIREWGTWRAECYGPAVSAIGLRPAAPVEPSQHLRAPAPVGGGGSRAGERRDRRRNHTRSRSPVRLPRPRTTHAVLRRRPDSRRARSARNRPGANGPLARIAVVRAISSVGQSASLIRRRSLVRVQDRPSIEPAFPCGVRGSPASITFG